MLYLSTHAFDRKSVPVITVGKMSMTSIIGHNHWEEPTVELSLGAPVTHKVE